MGCSPSADKKYNDDKANPENASAPASSTTASKDEPARSSKEGQSKGSPAIDQSNTEDTRIPPADQEASAATDPDLKVAPAPEVGFYDEVKEKVGDVMMTGNLTAQAFNCSSAKKVLSFEVSQETVGDARFQDFMNQTVIKEKEGFCGMFEEAGGNANRNLAKRTLTALMLADIRGDPADGEGDLAKVLEHNYLLMQKLCNFTPTPPKRNRLYGRGARFLTTLAVVQDQRVHIIIPDPSKIAFILRPRSHQVVHEFTIDVGAPTSFLGDQGSEDLIAPTILTHEFVRRDLLVLLAGNFESTEWLSGRMKALCEQNIDPTANAIKEFVQPENDDGSVLVMVARF